ncbi:LpqB family beta-propeller domain-containing protein [Streptomyces sp. NPDC058320]|uniref:LpqB family beta-propeller domain-containing protein n=1 Tax=unclassified Streptomyces TaxID=2593676 RepID=UPI0035E1FB4D
MPDNGGLQAVEASQRPDSQVRVFAMPPREHAGPDSIVEGFLEALTSDDPQYTMARKYLTAKAAKGWHPEERTTVLTDGPSTGSASRPSTGDEGRTFRLSGHQVAFVDQQQAYRPEGTSYSKTLHLVQENGPKGKQWRIDGLPQGVVLGQSDFQRIYQSVNKYYFALDEESSSSGGAQSGGGSGSGSGSGEGSTSRQKRLVADPVYVRQWIDPLTQTVRALLSGPTHWLNPVVTTTFPSDTRLRKGVKSLAPDDENNLKVPLNAKADHVGQARCKEMAAQLLFSLRDVTSASVSQIELERSNGSQLCVLSESDAEALVEPRTSGPSDDQYFLDDKGRLVQMSGASRTAKDPERVPGPLGDGEQRMRSVAVSRDETQAAAVSNNGSSLFVGSLVAGASLGDPVVRSNAKSEKDRLTTPSWDGLGDLWVADRDPKKPRLLMFGRGMADKIHEADVSGLDGGRIEAVKVSADGVRIALLVAEKGKTTLRIGRVERDSGPDGKLSVSVDELRAAAPQMEEVTAMSWAGGSRLVVVGRESGGVQQLSYVQCDGSAPTVQALPGLTGVKEIAASEDDRLPLVAHSDDGIVRLPPGLPWQTVLKDGTAPVYPG